MKTKTTILPKTTGLLMVLLLHLLKFSALAQVKYTDIPDATPNATYPLDLNNDSIVDFLIQFELSEKLVCKPQNNNSYAGNFVGGNHLAWALAASSTICDSTATWYSADTNGVMTWGTSLGYWVGESNKYLAFKLRVDSQTYFGWARFDVAATASSFTIKDYAYQSSPNTCILAGQTATGMGESISKPVFSIFPNPFVSETTIELNANLKNACLTIYNAMGQPVQHVKNINGESYSLCREKLPSGVYYLQLTDENNFNALEKLIITD